MVPRRFIETQVRVYNKKSQAEEKELRRYGEFVVIEMITYMRA